MGAFVTSAEWLEVNYGCLPRELVAGELGGVSIHVVDPEAVPFDGTATTAAVTCFEVGHGHPRHPHKAGQGAVGSRGS